MDDKVLVFSKIYDIPFESLNSGDSRNCLQKLVPRTPQPTTAQSDGDNTLMADEIGPRRTRIDNPVNISFGV